MSAMVYSAVHAHASTPRTHLPRRTSCVNCGQIHPPVDGFYSVDCSLVGGRSRRSGSQDLPATSEIVTLPMPTTIREQAVLFDQIWFWFHEMKGENTHLRDQLNAQKLDKGALRTHGPLLWLQVKRCDGSKAQTRNQENWEKLWQSLTHASLPDGSKAPVAWLSIRLSDRSPPSSPESECSLLAK